MPLYRIRTVPVQNQQPAGDVLKAVQGQAPPQQEVVPKAAPAPHLPQVVDVPKAVRTHLDHPVLRVVQRVARTQHDRIQIAGVLRTVPPDHGRIQAADALKAAPPGRDQIQAAGVLRTAQAQAPEAVIRRLVFLNLVTKLYNVLQTEIVVHLVECFLSVLAQHVGTNAGTVQ